MGRLVGLELHNFKSYRGTSLIGLGDASFTSIIGPNGAGKSNMMDAISFVLGIHAAHLRSNKLKDLIYRGRGNASQAPSEKFAFVCAYYEKDSGELVKFKREINLSGSSEYKINEKAVTSLQYTMALKSEGIFVKARNFLVFQGDIENVASQSPRDLAKMIETISGSAELEQEYLSLKEDQENAKAHCMAVFSRKRNLNSESKQYKEQMREQKIFENKLTEKSDAIKTLHLFKLYHNEKAHEKVVSEQNKIMKDINLVKQRCAEVETQTQSFAASAASNHLTNERLSSIVSTMRLKAEEIFRQVAPREAKVKALESKISLNNRKTLDLKISFESQSAVANAIQEEIEVLSREIVEFDEESLRIIENGNLAPQAVAEYAELRQKFLGDSGAEIERDLAILNGDMESLANSRRNIQAQISQSEAKISELKQEISWNYEAEAQDLHDTIQALISARDEKSNYRDELIKEQEKAHYSILEKKKEMKSVADRLNLLSSQLKETKKQKKHQEILALLKNTLKDESVLGYLGDLIGVTHKRYENAVITALGKNSDAIVVTNSSTAYKCIQILKDRRAGTATFIPLDSLQVDQVNLNFLRSLHPNARPAIDVIKIENPLYERVIQFAVEDTVITDTIEEARELKWGSSTTVNCKLISIDGSVIHKSGLVSGGMLDLSDQFSRRWTKKEWSSLNQRKEVLQSEIESKSRLMPTLVEINRVGDEISSLSSQIPELESKYARISRKISEREKEIAFHQEKIEATRVNLMEKDILETDLKARITEKQLQLRNLQEKIYSSFCSSYSVPSISSYEESFGAAARARTRRRNDMQRKLVNLKSSLEFHKEFVERTKERIEGLELVLLQLHEELRSEKEMLEAEYTDHAKAKAAYQAALEENREFESKFVDDQSSARMLERELAELRSELRSKNKASISCQERLMHIDAERWNLLRNCQLENVHLPLEDGLLEEVVLEEGVDTVSEQAYRVQIEYSILSQQYRDTNSGRLEAELKVAIENAEKELQKLTPNAKAVQRLREADQRLRDHERDFLLARQAEKKATEKFNALRHKRMELFSNAFKHISNKIDGIYKELTLSSVAPMGGSADLTLEDEDEPFAAGVRYHAMPPLKRFRDMELLSGGEKTMAALALLFAIHSYNPAPFFVLDEIDAALDNANVAKVARYIQKIASPSFQLIVISLKSTFFENSDALVGIYREQLENTSKTVSVDLRKYPEGSQPFASGEIAPAVV